MEINKHSKKRLKFFIILICIAALFLFIILNFSKFTSLLDWVLGVSTPLILGGCIAFVLNLLMDGINKILLNRIHFKKEGLKEIISLISAVVFLIIIIALILWIVLPQLIRSFRLLADSIPVAFDNLKSWTDEMLKRYPDVDAMIKDFQLTPENISSNLSSFLKSTISTTLNSTYKVISNVIGVIFTTFVGIMFSFYVLLSKKQIGRQGRQLLYSFLPEKVANEILYILHLAYKYFNAFIYGQVLEAIILFVMYLAVALIFRLPYSFMIAILIMIFSLIPLFGAYIAWAIALFLIIPVNPIDALTFTVIFLVISQIEGNLIYPRIVGTSIGLPGIWVLAAVTIGGNMFGIVGMIVSVPIVAIVYTLLSEKSQKQLRKKPKEVIKKVVDQPDWKEYNPDDMKFEDGPVDIPNVLIQYEDK